jgi:hypothetical protein
MEAEGSLPCSQEPAIGPYPESYESFPSYFPTIHSNITSHLRLFSQNTCQKHIMLCLFHTIFSGPTQLIQ